MCTSTCSKLSPCSPLYVAFSNQQPYSKGNSLRNHRLNRRIRLSKGKKVAILVKKEMEIKNLKLYMENRSIIEENEKLRKKAFLLHQENQALLYQLQKKCSNTTLHGHLAHNSN
ncbi:PROTEIN LITTLE ZIPPER 1 [Salix viminalis]|uniref:PROTEIN LITTLE ZIPPER 1 n=1 Tax=Salix viminalis TaxID=40686 RepID=A0A9Q0NTA3_SALVM|nr:PROTEIN LITTLE ZIPPER 1 [Salix viminalis]